MKIENVGCVEAATEIYRNLSVPNLIAQQIGVRASMHSLEFLLANGASEEVAKAMLHSLKQQLFAIHEVALARGIELMHYS